MKKNSKAIQKKFFDGVKEFLLDIGAVETPIRKGLEFRAEFKLQTTAGNLDIALRKDQEFLFSVINIFDDADRARDLFNSKQFSGKYNIRIFHNNPELAIDEVKGFFKRNILKN